ncbi:MAG: HEAT repeat domain-containing protein [Phycisphaeraceae bacterium]|nr:HEAT repeat domain-containing protein [Phycisphaeraceae bacterium]
MPIIVAAAGCLVALSGCGMDFDVREGSESFIGAIAPPTPAEAAAWAVDENNANNRTRGTLLLSAAPWGGADPYLALYEDYLDDPDPNVRAAATRAIGNHGRPEHVPALVKQLADPSPHVRLDAAVSLQRVHHVDAIDPLVAALNPDNEPEADVRAAVANALGQYATRSVLQSLIAALDDRNLRVNEAVLSSLRTLTGQDFGYSRAQWQNWFRQAPDLFAGRTPYIYPVFQRSRRWYEYIPFLPPPPNEIPDSPAGFPREVGTQPEG